VSRSGSGSCGRYVLSDLGQAAGRDTYTGPDRIAGAAPADEPDLQPVVTGRRLVPQNGGRMAGVLDHDIDPSVVVQIVKHYSARDQFDA